mgnify:CR=1 FL=1
MNIESLKQKLGYHGVLLGLVGLAASAALATANHATRGAIVAAEARDLESSLKQVLPEGFADNDLLKDSATFTNSEGATVVVYRARLGGEPKGAVFQVSSRGYAGDVMALMGVDAGGRILGVRVIKHQETPGLGDKIEIAKSKWITGFDGKSLQEPDSAHWGVKKDGGIFDQFAGATITPRAVVKAVKGGLDFYTGHKDEIFAKPAEQLAAKE